MKPIRCNHCTARFTVDDISREERDLLSNQYSYGELSEEMRMLRKVEAYRERHPDVDVNREPHFMRVMGSTEPKVIEQRMADVPFSEIRLPQAPELPIDGDEDREAVEYLNRSYFDFAARMQFVQKRLAEIEQAMGQVHCWSCGEGKLEIAPEDWNAFNTSPFSYTFYYPGSHEFRDDGTIVMSASGWNANSHWNGWVEVSPVASDYGYWKWLIVQRKRPERITSGELPILIKKWKRRTERRWWQVWRR